MAYEVVCQSAVATHQGMVHCVQPSVSGRESHLFNFGSPMISANVETQPSIKPRPVLDVNGERSPQVRTAGCGVWAVVVGVVVLALVGVGAYFVIARMLHGQAAAAGKSAGRGGAVPVVAAEAIKGDMDVFLTGLGTVTAYNTVTLRTLVNGQIMKINFTEGDMVKAGQPLVEIDPRPYQVQLEQAQGQLQKDQASLKDAQLNLNRYVSIPNSVTQQQVDTQKAAVAQGQGVVESDQSQVDSAKLNLVYCVITAPITGRIGLRQVDIGNVVHTTDANGLAVVAQVQPIAIVFTVPEDQITDIFRRPDHGVGLAILAYNRDFSKKIATGKVLAIDNQVDPSTGTVRIKGEFVNSEYELFPNQFVNARLLVNTLQGAVLVPSAAVQLGPQSTFVYVVKKDQTVELRTVKAGAKEGSQTAIEDGISPGELVVTDGVDKLTQGTKVLLHMADANGNATTQPAHGATSRPSRHGSTTRPAAVATDSGEAH